VVVVRYAGGQPHAPCMELGIYAGENKMFVYYTARERVKAFVPKGKVHLEPCPNCHDHPKTRFGRRKKE
jgi:hypothetical protein